MLRPRAILTNRAIIPVIPAIIHETLNSLCSKLYLSVSPETSMKNLFNIESCFSNRILLFKLLNTMLQF